MTSTRPDSASHPARAAARRLPVWGRVVAGLAALLVLLGLLLAFFPWDWLRAPLGRLVSERIDRRFEITRHLDLRFGRHLTVRAQGLVLANPPWARAPHLLKAESVEMDLRWWPLLSGRLEIPRLQLDSPVFGLEQHADGRRSWVLGRQNDSTGAVPQIGGLQMNQGQLTYVAPARGMDLQASFALRPVPAQTRTAPVGAELPLSFSARGRYQGLPFAAQGRSGGVLQLHAQRSAPFPLELQATAGRTQLKAAGTVTALATLEALDLAIELQGPSLAELDSLVDAVLPTTRAYRLKGRLKKSADVWRMNGLQGVLGRSDLAGDLAFDRSGQQALLSGSLQSKRLDMDDLGPLIGAKPLSAGKTPAGPQPRTRSGKLLPARALDLAGLARMNADVSFSAQEVRNARGWPLERLRTHVRLQGGALQLDPLVLGVAGGEMTGRLALGGQSARVQNTPIALRLDARGLQLNRLFPRVEQTRSSLGKASGFIDVRGQGQSVAQWLGSASGELGFLMGRGQISNILLEFMGLDGGEIIKFLVRGDQNIQLRCAALAFGLNQGLMQSRVLLLDTVDTVIRGQGQINLATERMELLLVPEPKDTSILSMRSPLRIGGMLAAPDVGPDKAALAGRAGLAIALGVINPLLALAATVETGPGENANCAQALETARKAGR